MGQGLTAFGPNENHKQSLTPRSPLRFPTKQAAAQAQPLPTNLARLQFALPRKPGDRRLDNKPISWYDGCEKEDRRCPNPRPLRLSLNTNTWSRAPDQTIGRCFSKAGGIRAAVVDETINGPDPYTPEEFARDFHVTLEAVHEALEYVARNRALIEQERDREAADVRARGLDRPQRP